MVKLTHAAALGGALLVAACAGNSGGYEVAATDNEIPPAALVAAPTELSGTVIRAVSADGSVVNRVHFYPDGAIQIVPEDGDVALPGTYTVRDDQLCLNWAPRGTECWPYRQAFRQGETVTVTSNLGQTAQITLLTGAALAGAPTEATAPAYPPPAPTYAPPAEVRAGERG